MWQAVMVAERELRCGRRHLQCRLLAGLGSSKTQLHRHAPNDPEADSRSRAASSSLNFGSEATSGFYNPMAIGQARAYADLAAELDVMKVKVRAFKQRVDPLYADVERLITSKCQSVDAKIKANADDAERRYGLTHE